MQQDLTDSRMVLCVCSDGYDNRASNSSSGVWEEMEAIKKSNKNKDYIIPVIKNNPNRRIPNVLSSYNPKYINADQDSYEEIFDNLIQRIWSEDLRKIPSIGPNPFTNNSSTDLDRQLRNHKIMYHNPNLEGIVQFTYKDNDGEFIIGRGDYKFTTKWTGRGIDSIYAYNDGEDIERIAYVSDNEQIPNNINDILEKYEINSFSSRVREPKINELVIWQNTNGKFAVTKIDDVKNDKVNNEFEIKFSFKIFTQ